MIENFDDINEPTWHMPNNTTLIVERPDGSGGVRTTVYEWETPPSEEIVLRAVSSDDIVREPGQTHDARRIHLIGEWWIYLHRDGGPPRWTLPRVIVKIKRGRYEVGGGWLYRCYSATLRKDTTSKVAT